MSKARLRWIIGLMSLTLTGLVAFQWYWVETVVKGNEERFHRDVLSAMDRVVQKLEKQEALYLVNQRVLRQSIRPANPGNHRFEVQRKSNGYYYEFQGGADSSGFSFYFSLDASGQINFSSSDDTLTPFHGHDVDDSTLEREQLAATLQKVGNKSEMVVTLLEDMMVPRRLSNRIDVGLLDSLLQDAFQENGIRLDYSFGVIKPSEGRFVSISDPRQNRYLSTSAFQTHLFPNDIVGDPSILSVHFPGKSDYLLGKMWMTISSSAALVLIILFCFGYAVYTIVRQKNISEMKSDFINNMTHEFKTPIATIGLAVEALQDRDISETVPMRERYVGVIGEENKRLGSQVEKVLQMALIDKNELELVMEEVDVHELVDKAVSKISLQVEKQEGALSTSLSAGKAEVMADASHLMNVILNLLDNAIKYSPDGPKIMIRTQSDRMKLTISIKDHGIGMTREEVKHIFQRFYRVPTGNLHNVKGFGLGLAYVKNVVDLMNGEIEVDSEPNNGTNFILKFPLK